MKLNFDRELFQAFEDAYESSNTVPSEYWSSYVDIVKAEIENEGLNGFGTSYDLTKGFGDAMSYPKRTRVRKYIPLPFIYLWIEKFLTTLKFSKSQHKTFNESKNFFTNTLFIEELSKELNETVSKLGINRYAYVNNNKVPWRYLQAFTYFELIEKILNNNKFDNSLKEILSGNSIDIGGGYGPFIDSISLYKASISNNCGVNYLLDQFPVSYIANQYLHHRYKEKLLPPIISRQSLRDEENDSTNSQYIRVIQSNVASELTDLNINFFFNSNSFQEMDSYQIESYSDFIKNNATNSAVLACFFYDRADGNDTSQMPLNILRKKFAEIGSEILNLNGYIKGTLYLFSV